jgi:hypothetical protein
MSEFPREARKGPNESLVTPLYTNKVWLPNPWKNLKRDGLVKDLAKVYL